MHTTISDGTDTLSEILSNVKNCGIELFSVTDHDAIRGGEEMPKLLQPGDPAFITGVEFSCKDEKGKYHILGYGYDPEDPAIRKVIEKGHGFRMTKTKARLDYIKKEFGFTFSDEDVAELLARDNPGKPHIGNLMVKYGYAETKEQGIRDYINKKRFASEYVSPKEAIEGIIQSGGIPILAHPSYGTGEELILGDEMDERLKHLMAFGLRGVEAYYSGFTPRIQDEMLAFADKYNLYVTAGSDYHGTNKVVVLGDNNLNDVAMAPEGLHRFLADVKILNRYKDI